MELNRNDPCQCDSGLKYKHCCLKMDQERKKWEELENNLRESITEYWQEFILKIFTMLLIFMEKQ